MTIDEQIELRAYMGARQFQLTPRQLQVVLAILRGHTSTYDIAVELGVAVHTARQHVWKLYEKFGVHSKPQLAAKVIGLVMQPDA